MNRRSTSISERAARLKRRPPGRIEEARENLREALELIFETASPAEIRTRLHEEIYVTRVEVAIG